MISFVDLPGTARGSVERAGNQWARPLQVIPLRQSITVTVYSDMPDVDVMVGDSNVVSVSPAGKPGKDGKRKFTVRGIAPGSTAIYAVDSIGVIFDSVDISVVSDSFGRRVGSDMAHTTEDIRAAAKGMSLRDAVMLVAEDQMNSNLRKGNGFGTYGPADADWCGFFAWWCWDRAAKLKNMANPFASDSWTLASPIRAVSWALRDDTPGQLLQYDGGDEFKGGKAVQEYREIGYNGYQLERGDIVLLHKKHVCLVYDTDGSSVMTMNGNQGNGNCIKLVKRSIDDVVNGRKLYFIHVLV